MGTTFYFGGEGGGRFLHFFFLIAWFLRHIKPPAYFLLFYHPCHRVDWVNYDFVFWTVLSTQTLAPTRFSVVVTSSTSTNVLKVSLIYRVTHKRHPIAKIWKVDVFHYFTFIFITEKVRDIFQFKETGVFFGKPCILKIALKDTPPNPIPIPKPTRLFKITRSGSKILLLRLPLIRNGQVITELLSILDM